MAGKPGENYNKSMSRRGVMAARWAVCVLLAAGLAAAQSPGKPPEEDAAPAQDSASSNGLPPPLTTEMPPEEDASKAPKVYSFNPVQSQREVTAGDFYFTKGNYTAAASRFTEATKWNDGNAEAWMRLGETEEKRRNPKAAREAYQKYLELAPDAKNAGEIRKRLAKLKG